MRHEIAKRVDEALRLVRRYQGTTYEPAARAYLAAQVEQAHKGAHAVRQTAG
jgi:hypothetical protein